MEGKTRGVNRKRGVVVPLYVEINSAQARMFDDTIKRLQISKADAIAAALNIWLSMVNPPTKES